jgi:hypothetical protein
MNCRTFLCGLTIGTLVAPFTADAQQAPEVPRVGVFFASNPMATTRNNEAFTQELRERGYVEGPEPGRARHRVPVSTMRRAEDEIPSA